VNARARLAGTGGEGLRQLRRVDVTIEGIPQRALKVRKFQQRVAFLEPLGREDLVVDAVRLGKPAHVAVLVHALRGVRKPHRAGEVIVDGVANLGPKAPVERRRVLLQLHDADTRGEGRAVARGVPGGP
jgi:hypothetical protein